MEFKKTPAPVLPRAGIFLDQLLSLRSYFILSSAPLSFRFLNYGIFWCHEESLKIKISLEVVFTDLTDHSLNACLGQVGLASYFFLLKVDLHHIYTVGLFYFDFFRAAGFIICRIVLQEQT